MKTMKAMKAMKTMRTMLSYRGLVHPGHYCGDVKKKQLTRGFS